MTSEKSAPGEPKNVALTGTIVALCGGIGGAKLALGLYRTLPPQALTVIVNTGDDFEHLGLHVSPDLDTVLYTLAGLDNPETGWGRRRETWTFMQALESLGGEAWFQLGDGDLALHVERTRRLRSGESLSGVTAFVAAQWNVDARILPMSDDPVRTLVDSQGQTLGFQEYFVARRCEPPVDAIRFQGADRAKPVPDALRALTDERTQAVIICPSNPYLSVDPLLAIPDLRSALAASSAPVIAVTPIIGGAAIKGPTAKIMRELGRDISPFTIARHYAGLIDGFVLDHRDAELVPSIDVPVCVADTLMHTLDHKRKLAATVIEFAQSLHKERAA